MNSKAKGNNFERQISEKLSLWLTSGKEKRAVWRSDTSGAAATIWHRKNKESNYVKQNTGDIRRVADKGIYPELDKFFDKYVVECKNYKEIDFYPPFNSVLVKFFKACKAEQSATGKIPFLILKANNRKILACIGSAKDTPNLDFQYAKKYFTTYYEDLCLDIYLLDDLMSKNYS